MPRSPVRWTAPDGALTRNTVGMQAPVPVERGKPGTGASGVSLVAVLELDALDAEHGHRAGVGAPHHLDAVPLVRQRYQRLLAPLDGVELLAQFVDLLVALLRSIFGRDNSI
jgi:hypothetical protein